jgi:hypothetical protein
MTQAQLPEYATAIALGHTHPRIAPAVAKHLHHCAACAEEFQMLIDLAVAAFNGTQTVAATYPAPDLSFLDPPPSSPFAQEECFLDKAGRVVIAFSHALLARLRQPSWAGALRGALLYHYTQSSGPRGEVLVVDVYADDDEPAMARVTVTCELPDRDPFDQAGTLVELQAAEGRWSGKTDETGCVHFRAVALDVLPQLRVLLTLARSG